MQTLSSDISQISHALAQYSYAHLDLGCGDGLDALRHVKSRPDTLVVGMDICLDNLARQTRKAPKNLVFLQTDATRPAPHLAHQFDSMTIAFPFGSLLRASLTEDVGHILSPLKPGGQVEVLINDSAALATLGRRIIVPDDFIALRSGVDNIAIQQLSHTDVRQFPSSWAKRIGFGKPTMIWRITGKTRKPGAYAPGPVVRFASSSSRLSYPASHR